MPRSSEPLRSRIERIYDQRAPGYDSTVGMGERLLVGDLRRRFGALLQGETLEVAVGSGLNLPHRSASVTRYIAVDLSHGMLAQAQRRTQALGQDVALAQMDAEQLAFPDASFDTVAISLALCTIPRPEVALRELARVCRPGGRVIFLEHVRSPVRPVAWLQRLLSPLQERALGCHLDRETTELLRCEGFSIKAEQRRCLAVFRLITANPPVTHRTGSSISERGAHHEGAATHPGH